jgi:hypothetical protein
MVIFNPATIKDKATDRFPYSLPLENYPQKYPEGIEYVIVNGQIVVQKGKHTGIFLGKFFVTRRKIVFAYKKA